MSEGEQAREPIFNPDSKHGINPTVSRVAFGVVDVSYLAPGRKLADIEDIVALREKKPEDLSYDTVNAVSLDSRKKYYEGDGKTFEERNKAWNEGFWNNAKKMIGDDVDSALRTERQKAFSSLGLNLKEDGKDGDLYTEVEAFRIKYVNTDTGDAKQFIKDLSADCRNPDGSVNLEQLNIRLTAIEPLLVIFGEENDADLLVKDFATVHGMLSQRSDVKHQSINHATTQLAKTISDSEQRRLTALRNKQEELTKASSPEPPPLPEPEPTQRPDKKKTPEILSKRNENTVIGASVRGASHERKGTVNQDAIRQTSADTSDQFFVGVADGHGSEKHFRSDRGSKLAVGVMTEQLEKLSEGVRAGNVSLLDKNVQAVFSQAVLEEWKKHVKADYTQNPFTKDELDTFEEIKTHPETAYGSTILGATVINDEYLLLSQLGDGDIVLVDSEGKASMPMPEDPNLIANETSSLSEDDPSKMRIVVIKIDPKKKPRMVMLSTDGLSNSFTSKDDFFKFVTDVDKEDDEVVKNKLVEWLTIISSKGSGDDITCSLVRFAT